MATNNEINELLNDKLFQVIGSTPASIAESLAKVDLRGKTKEGAQVFAIAVFAAAVNKSTLETFLADARFASVRPLITAALSIQGRSNMTALTLLGHCFLTTATAANVTFTQEFRKKMGQNHLWDGNLESGSLSEKQKAILKEKKRVTNEEEAKALGSGFLKHVGLDAAAMTSKEREYFGASASSRAPGLLGSRFAPKEPAPPPRTDTTPPRQPTSQRARVPSPESPVGSVRVTTTGKTEATVPEDVYNYRRNILGHSDDDIIASVEARGLDDFIKRTRTLMERDPTGEKVRSASTAAG